jgi:hypothetical protein
LGQTVITIEPKGAESVAVRELSFRTEGEKFVRSTRVYPGGEEKIETFSATAPDFQLPANAGPYKGYYCPGVKPVH